MSMYDIEDNEPWESSVEEPTRSVPLKGPGKPVAFDQPICGNDHEAAQSAFRESSRTYRNTESLRNSVSFTEELTQVINRYSEENNSNTPDFILAEYMRNALDSFNIAVQAREKWYGRKTF